MLFGGIIFSLSATSFNVFIGIGFKIKATANSLLSTLFLISESGVVPDSKVIFLFVFSSLIPKIGNKILLDKMAGSNLLTQSA